MRHHFHRCSHLRVISAEASEISGGRRGGSVILDELCGAKGLARCVGLAECDVLTPAEKRELLVARVTRLREETGTPLSPLGDLGGARGQELLSLRESLLEEREAIRSENRRLLAEAAAALEAQAPISGQDVELAEAGLSVRGSDPSIALGSARLDAIDRALEEIAGGRYGVCARCGNLIEIDRLRNAPDTIVCGSCVAS